MTDQEYMNDEWEQQGTTFIPFDADSESLSRVESTKLTKLLYTEEDPEDQPYVDEPLPRSQFDLPGGPLLRFQAYKAAWGKCLGRVKEITHILQNPVVDDIVHSVQNAYIDSTDDIILPSSELVTLLVSSSDRTYLHEALARIAATVCEEDDLGSQDDAGCGGIPGAFISRLSEFECQSTTTLMKALIGGFISQPLGNKPSRKIKPSLSLASSDMCLLRAWYQAVQAYYETKIPALIVLMQDLHTIDPVILRDLFEICSLHVPHLPLIFVLGTSDPNHLHSVLPRSTLACMRVERHVLPLDMKALERVIKETFFSPNFTPDVMLGPVGFGLVFEEFKRHNATLDAVLSALQLLHMQHFYNPLSFIIDPSYDPVLSDVLDTPSEEWKPFLQLIRQHCIPTLLNAQGEKDEPEWPDVTPQEVIQTVVKARNTFRTRMNRMKVAVHVLDTLLKFVRGHGKKTLDISFEKMGIEALRGTLGQKNARGVCDLVRQLKPEETLALLEELFHLLQNLPSNVRNAEGELKRKVVVVKNLKGLDGETVASFAEFLIGYFKQTLIPFEDIACLDVWWTGETGIPHSPLNPNPHVSIVTALLEPGEYLGWFDSTETRRGRESSSLPDTCILFRRYVESGKMINIYDWYDSFAMALEGETDNDGDSMDVDETPTKSKGKGKEKAPPKGKRTEHEAERKREVQARFMRSMHELEFVGFLKHTGRKADHVVKTVFDVLD